MAITSNASSRWVTGELAGSTGSGITQTVGHANVATFVHSGSDVSDNILDCTTGGGTISAPEEAAWTDIANFAIGEPITVFIAEGASFDHPVTIRVDDTEDADDAVRMQLIIDGVTVWDQTATKDAALVTVNMFAEVVSDDGVYGKNFKFNCKSSFQLRATRNGTFSDVDTDVEVGSIYYVKYQ